MIFTNIIASKSKISFVQLVMGTMCYAEPTKVVIYSADRYECPLEQQDNPYSG